MRNFIQSLRFTLVICLSLGSAYILLLWGFGRLAAPAGGNPETVVFNDRIVGVNNIGQSFTETIYFWGRPSCAGSGYDASASGGSNKGVANKAYLQEVKERTAFFLRQHPYLRREEIPAEMVTASGSGLDPHITPQSAYVQVKRIARARAIPEEQIRQLIDSLTQKSLLNLFGPSIVNVLSLNIALDCNFSKNKSTE